MRVREDFDKTYDDEAMAHELSEQERQALAKYRRKKLVEEDFKE